MARCIGCGNENPADAKFCRQCGKSLDPGGDDGPATVVPGQPGYAPAAPRRLNGTIVGLIVAGLLAAAAAGYFLGARSAGTPAPVAALPPTPATAPARPAATAAEAASPAAPAAAEPTASPASKAGHVDAAKPAAQPPSPAAAAEDDRWTRMRAELAACSKANLVCRERVRWRYCKHLWGKVPDCPQAGANASSN